MGGSTDGVVRHTTRSKAVAAVRDVAPAPSVGEVLAGFDVLRVLVTVVSLGGWLIGLGLMVGLRRSSRPPTLEFESDQAPMERLRLLCGRAAGALVGSVASDQMPVRGSGCHKGARPGVAATAMDWRMSVGTETAAP